MKRTVRFYFCIPLLLLSIGFAVLLTACSEMEESGATWQEQYDLGVKYLSEGNYEEAIVAFTAAIEIDPKRPEAYLKAAEAYEAMGDYEAAADILEKGYLETGDERLNRADGGEALADDDTRDWALETMLTPETLTVGGTPFYLLDIEAFADIYPPHPQSLGMGTEEIRQNEENGFWFYETSPEGSNFLRATQDYDAEHITVIQYRGGDYPELYHPEFLELTLGSPTRQVLSQVGLTDRAIDYLYSCEDGGVFGTSEAQQLWEEKQELSFQTSNEVPNVFWEWARYESGQVSLYVTFLWLYDDVETIGATNISLQLDFVNGILSQVELSNR